MNSKLFFLPMVLLPLIAGCRTYEAKPLLPTEILEQVEASRNLISEMMHDAPPGRIESGEAAQPSEHDPALTGSSIDSEEGFNRMAQWMIRLGPELLRARSEFDQASAVAEIDTPLPNPELSAGPLIGTRLGPGAGHKIQPALDFGFAIPLNNRLRKNDDVLDAKADEAFVSYVVTQREQYLLLRKLYVDWVLSKRRFAVQKEIRTSTQRSLELTRRMVEAGMASALDVGLMELEAAHQEAELLKSQSHCAEIEGSISKAVGVGIGKVREVFSPHLPAMEIPLPALDEAKANMVANHNGLALLRARYEVTEKALRLACALQYPDLEFGVGYEGDPGDRKRVWGLSVGIALPLFDRNQHGIAEAETEREKARVAYTSLLNESLGTLEGLYEQYGKAMERFTVLRDDVLPRSEANLEVALKSIRSGAIDSLKYLEVERTMRSLLIEVITAEQEIRRLVNEMERLMGMPLALFPGEREARFPRLEPEKDNGAQDDGTWDNGVQDNGARDDGTKADIIKDSGINDDVIEDNGIKADVVEDDGIKHDEAEDNGMPNNDTKASSRDAENNVESDS